MNAPTKFLFDVDFAGGAERKPAMSLAEHAQKLAEVEAAAYRRGYAEAQADAKVESDRRLAGALERIADGIARTVVKNLKVMARMGVFFEEEVQRRYPEFPTRTGERSWEDYLPPMNASLRQLVAAYS